MPEIVKRGTPPPKHDWLGTYKCVYCDSILKLTEADKGRVREISDDQRDGYSVKVTCPVCQTQRWLTRIERWSGPYD